MTQCHTNYYKPSRVHQNVEGCSHRKYDEVGDKYGNTIHKFAAMRGRAQPLSEEYSEKYWKLQRRV